MATVVITGAALGIGRATAIAFAKKKYNVVLTYHTSKKEAEELSLQLEDKYKVKTLVLACDIAQEDDIKKMVQAVKEKFLTVDVLVNNAATYKDCLFVEKTKAEFMKILEVNLVGTFLVSKYIGELMYENQAGSIINLTSTNGINQYFPMSIDYDASKAAIISLTHNLAVQYAPYIRVNAVAPGWVKTEKEMMDLSEEYISSEEDKILLQRFAEVEEIAKVITFLASKDASYINNTVITVDGGMR